MLPNILVVDDDIQILETMRLYLNNTAIVATVLGGRQAIEHVRNHPVDLILLDIDMPVMDGFKTLEQLRKIEECINVPIILVTGKSDMNTVLNSGLMGIDGYLVKPVNQLDLISKVTEVYQAHQQVNTRKTVLMIDDDISYLKQMNTFLQDKYNVVIINSAKLGASYLLNNTPDVIILDYEMPLYNGAALMNMIHKNNNGYDIPIIILSGALNIDAVLDCYEYRPFSCLAKPVTKELLIENIEKALLQVEYNSFH